MKSTFNTSKQFWLGKAFDVHTKSDSRKLFLPIEWTDNIFGWILNSDAIIVFRLSIFKFANIINSSEINLSTQTECPTHRNRFICVCTVVCVQERKWCQHRVFSSTCVTIPIDYNWISKIKMKCWNRDHYQTILGHWATKRLKQCRWPL